MSRIVIWVGLAVVGVAILLAGAIQVRATDLDQTTDTYHCGTLLAPNAFPNSTREDLGNAMIVNDDCERARNLRGEWATGVGILGLAIIAIGVSPHLSRRVSSHEPERELISN